MRVLGGVGGFNRVAVSVFCFELESIEEPGKFPMYQQGKARGYRQDLQEAGPPNFVVAPAESIELVSG